MLSYRYVECFVRKYWVVGSSAYIAVKTSHKNFTGYIPFRRTALFNSIKNDLLQFSLHTGNSPYRCTRGCK